MILAGHFEKIQKLDPSITEADFRVRKAYEPTPIKLEDALKLDDTYRHVAHCFLYYGTEDKVYGLMQMREDGKLGFPGGTVEGRPKSPRDIVNALNRELEEEINYKGNIEPDSRVMSHLHLTPKGNGVTHFFMKRVSEDEFRKIEKEHMEARDFPKESLGIFRVPIYSDEPKFLANFAQNNFLANFLDYLLEAIDIIKSSNN